MKAGQIVQRIGVTLARSLLSEARKPIGVHYESEQGVDMDYVLHSVFYIYMDNLRNLVNMPLELWIAIEYTLDENGNQDLGFSITHNKIAPCELHSYPLRSIEHAVAVIKKFFSYSMLPYFDEIGATQNINLPYLEGKYGKAEAWGDTVTLGVKAEDFPYDVDFSNGVFRGFSDRMLESMVKDVQLAMGTPEELKYRIYSKENNIGIVFIPKITYSASKYVPREL